MAAVGMEALQSRSFLMNYDYGIGSSSHSNFPAAAATPAFPSSGYRRDSSFAATSSQVGRFPHSSASPMAFPYWSLSVSQECSLGPVVATSGRECKIPCCLTRGRSLCTTAINWLCPSASFSSSLSRGGKLRASFAGNWSSSAISGSGSIGTRDVRELLLIASHPFASRGRIFSVSIATTPKELRQRRGEGELQENILHKILKIPASSIFSWLKRKRSGVLEIRPARHLSTGYHWRSLPICKFFRFTSYSTAIGSGAESHYLPRHQGLGAIRSTSDYYNGYSGVSSQAEGSGLLENATMMDQQQQQIKEFLATGYGWRVRDAVRGELQELIRVADIQTGAFHERSAIFDELLHKIFHAEVLSSLQYKMRHFAPDRYACLLAERDPTHVDSLEDVQYEEIEEQTIVGAVDVTALSDKDILSHLPGEEEYLYISGMAVDSNYRRRSVATLLLKACLARALDWGFTYLVLHAHEDDFRARNLYSRAGYRTVAADPAWMSRFLGRRRRVILAKNVHEEPDSV